MKWSLEKILCAGCWVVFAGCLLYAGVTKSRDAVIVALITLVPIADMILLQDFTAWNKGQSPGCSNTIFKILGLVSLAGILLLILRFPL